MGKGQHGSAAAGVQGFGGTHPNPSFRDGCLLATCCTERAPLALVGSFTTVSPQQWPLHHTHCNNPQVACSQCCARLGGVLHNALHGVAHNHGHTLVQGLLGDIGCRRKQRVCTGRLVSRCKPPAGQRATPLPEQRLPAHTTAAFGRPAAAAAAANEHRHAGAHAVLCRGKAGRETAWQAGRTGLEELLGGALHHVLAKLDQSLQMGTANGTNVGLGEAAVGGLRLNPAGCSGAAAGAHACRGPRHSKRAGHTAARVPDAHGSPVQSKPKPSPSPKLKLLL